MVGSFANHSMSEELKNNIEENYSAEIGKEITFHGALYEFFDEIASPWKAEKTLSDYQRDFRTRILPYVSDEQPLRELSKEYFDSVLESVKEDYYEQEKKALSLHVEQHLKYIIYRVVATAAAHNLCEDIFWGTTFKTENPDDSGARQAKELMNLQKSLQPLEEKKIFQEIMLDHTAPGQNIGIATMFCAGLRNEEACGLDFGDLIEMREHPGNFCLRIYKTTAPGTNVLQPGGKTKNAPRMVPIPDALVTLLIGRKEYVRQQLELASIEASVDALPIACRNNRFQDRCYASDLSLAGRLIFKKVKVNESTVRYVEEEIDAVVSEEVDANQELPVKDATTYLFRRNMATHMYILGLTEPEIKYIMGHAIEDDYETRNGFCNEDKLFKIKQKLNKRPLVNTEALCPPSAVCVAANETLTGQAAHSVTFNASGNIRLSITANEPDDAISISVKSSKTQKPSLRAIVTEAPNKDYSSRRTIDVTYEYQKGYK